MLRSNMLRFIAGLVLIFCLTACGSGEVSRSVLNQAITLQLEYTQQELSQQLGLPAPDFQVRGIKVSRETPMRIDQLPAYQVQGEYTSALKFPHRTVVQKHNPFVVYLQQQVEGETWRLFIPEAGEPESLDPRQYQAWSSYLIAPG